MIDKSYCMSSYLAFRYIEKDGFDFAEGLHHRNYIPISDRQTTLVHNHNDIDDAIKKVFENLKNKNLGILLSGGMDSANLASYMRGAKAYTFRYLGRDFQKIELERAEHYAQHYGLELHYVDVTWDGVMRGIDPILKEKQAPVHSIETQIYQAAIQAKRDGVDHMIVGESADLLFGGMDQLLSKDWTVEEFAKRYTFTQPKEVLREYADTSYLFERYRKGNRIDLLSFMDNVFSIESSSSYLNAFAAAGMPYTDPYSALRMAEPLDLKRVRSGEPKYLIRDLFASKYPEIPIPAKIPMPRPVDFYFKEWCGPTRPEFIPGLDMNLFTGDQKWQLWCLEYFLNKIEEWA